MGQKIGRRPQTQLCGDALGLRMRTAAAELAAGRLHTVPMEKAEWPYAVVIAVWQSSYCLMKLQYLFRSVSARNGTNPIHSPTSVIRSFSTAVNSRGFFSDSRKIFAAGASIWLRMARRSSLAPALLLAHWRARQAAVSAPKVSSSPARRARRRSGNGDGEGTGKKRIFLISLLTTRWKSAILILALFRGQHGGIAQVARAYGSYP